MPTLSLVVPCFNEQDVLAQTVRRLALAGTATGASFEIILVDDGSTDRTWELIREAAAKDPSILGLRLARNHGQQAALLAGLAASRGDFVLTLDADLQDPPELAAAMLARAREGNDIVFGVRRSRAGERWLKLATAWCFHRLLNLLAPHPIPIDSGDFRLMSRRAVDALLARPDRDRYLRAVVSELGMPQAGLPFDRAPRAAGETKYSYGQLAGVAWRAFSSTLRRPPPAGAPRIAAPEIRETTRGRGLQP